jgi:sugar phosphate isomerase/epimerase
VTILPRLGVALSVAELENQLDFVRNAGRDVELQDFISADVLSGDWRPLADRARGLLDGHAGRWGIHGPFWGFSLAAGDPDVRAIVHKRLDQGLAVCEAIGGTHMVIHSPVSIWDDHNLDNWPDTRTRLFENVHANLAPAVKRAEEIGCTLVLENIEDCDPKIRVDLVATFQSPAIKVSLDTGHANYVHCMHRAPAVDYYVRAAGRELAHVHIQDTDGYADRHWAPGEGNIPWTQVFRALHQWTALAEDGQDSPRLIVELRDKSAIPAGIAHLEGLGLAS